MGGSVSTGIESDDNNSDENNANGSLDAIASVLFQHPTIQGIFNDPEASKDY